MVKRLGYSLVCLLAFASCQREADDVQPAQAQPEPVVVTLNPVASFVQTAVPDPAAAEFISGEFDGHFINCTTGGENTYRTASDQGLLIRQNASRDIQLNISINSINLFTTAMPTLWPQYVANPVVCQGLWLDLYWLAPNNSVKALFIGETDTQLPYPVTNRMKFTVTSVKDNIVEGTFEGPLYVEGPLTVAEYHAQYGDKAYSAITVKNGKFRIKANIL